MAKKITEEAEVIVTLNGEAAKKTLDELKGKAEDFRKRANEAFQAGDQALGKKLSDQATRLEKQFTVAKREVKNLSDVLNSINTSTIDELTRAKKALNGQIKKLVPGTKEYIAATENYKKIEARINSLNAAYKRVDATQANMMTRISSFFQKYFAMVTTTFAAITGLTTSFKKCASLAAELDDIYSDVMKTTGLLHDEVKALDGELMKLDTRTSREQLLMLARDAGKLGISGSKNILDFVAAADKINVALGEDLGEGAVRELGKISDVFGLTDLWGIGDSLTKIGSSINAVGQASTANEAYLVQFTQRLAGAMAQAKISVADTIGFASAFDQSGMAVEMASTALQQFITKMFTDTATFAKYARMEVDDFTRLLETDANKAIVTVMKSLNQSGGFAEMIGMFKDMGADGVRAVSALSAVAKNIDAVTEAQAIANAEFEKGTSLQQEFDTKNNNLQAQLEKARKEFHNASIALGQSLNPVMLKSTKLTTYLIKLLASHGKEIRNAMIAVAALTVAVKAHTIIMAVWNGLTKVGAAFQATWTAAQYLSAAAVSALRGQTVRATAEIRLFNRALNASVFGLVATAIAGLTTVITHWVKKAREAREAQVELGKVEEKAAERRKDEEAEIRVLTKIVHDNNISLDERQRALKRLKEIVPGYLADLTKEGELVNDNTEAITNYIKAMRQRAVMEIMSEEIKEMEKQRIEAERRLEDAKAKRDEELVKAGGDTSEQITRWGGGMSGAMVTVLTDYGAAAATVRRLEGELNELIQEQDKVYASYNRKVEENTDILKENAEVKEEILNPEDDAFKDALARLEAQQQQELNVIKQSYIDKEISQAEYEEAVEDSNMAFLKRKIELARQYGEDETKYQAAYLDAEIRQMQKADAEMKRIQEESTKKLDEENRKRLADQRKTFQETIKMAEGYLKELVSPADEFHAVEDELLYLYERGLFDDEQYQIALTEQRKKYAKKMMDETAKTEEKGLMKQYSAEKSALQQLLKQEMITREEFEKKMIELRVEYAARAMEQISTVLNAAGNLVSSMRDAEMASAEAQYQADLTAAGDNAEEKERIEAEYEQKQLDIKKKYATVDMTIGIAKATADGALAIMKAWADLGPVGAGVMTALITATTAAQIATLVAQRNAIMNTSVSSSGSGSGSGTTLGQRVLNGGMKDGGFAGSDPSDNTPMGVYHANEYIAPAWMVRREPVLFRNMEEYRTSGHRPQSFTPGMKEGGYTTPASTQTSGGFDTKALNDTLSKVNATMEKMMSEGVQSFMVYDQFKDFNDTRNRFKKITSRK